MVRIQNFDASGVSNERFQGESNFEKNLETLGERAREVREKIGVGKEMSDETVVKESIRSLTDENLETAVGGGQARQERPDFLPDYIGSEREADVRAALDKYITLALHGDLVRAVQDAKKNLPLFLEDVFRDALVDKVLPLMKERGLL